jgi:hypothetical protein
MSRLPERLPGISPPGSHSNGAELRAPTPIFGPMQPASQVSPDGKYWWDGQTWQRLPTPADAPELDVARAADPTHYGQVAGAVVLWAVLLLGIGIVALGAIVLIDLLIPGHPKATGGGVATGVFLIAVGGLVSLATVPQSGWFTRPAYPASVSRSRMPWVLWTIVVLGIGIVALGTVVILDLLSPHHPKTLTAAPGVFLIGLGGLVCLGPTLRLFGFGLSISQRTQAPRSAKLARRQTRSERARMQVAISGMVLLVVGVFVGTARKAGIGGAIVATLATAVAFGIPVSIAWARQRRDRSVPVGAAPPPPAPTLSGSMTIGPSRFNLWVIPIISVPLAVVFLGNGYDILVYQGLGDPWFAGAFAVFMLVLLAAVLIFVAYWSRKAYIRVDESTITFGPSLTTFAARRNTVNRREVARIRATYSPLTRITLFLRSDGSTLTSTPGLFWGRDGLQRVADFLGVPLEW